MDPLKKSAILNETQPGDPATVIYDRGCLRAGEEWVERNLVIVAGVTVALAVLQVGRRGSCSLGMLPPS